MKCQLCGFNPEEPIGRIIKTNKDGTVQVELNDNGVNAAFCPCRHTPVPKNFLNIDTRIFKVDKQNEKFN